MKDEEIIQEVEQFVHSSFEHQSKIPKVIAAGMVRHLFQTRDYVRELSGGKGNLTALEIASLLHGVERAFRLNKKYKQFDKYEHEMKSALVAEDLLKKHKAPKALIAKVKTLIIKHERGGDKESQMVMEAHNLSFLENTLPIWFEANLWLGEPKKKILETSKKLIDNKYKFIKSKKGKEMAKKYYEKWVRWIKQREEAG